MSSAADEMFVVFLCQVRLVSHDVFDTLKSVLSKNGTDEMLGRCWIIESNASLIFKATGTFLLRTSEQCRKKEKNSFASIQQHTLSSHSIGRYAAHCHRSFFTMLPFTLDIRIEIEKQSEKNTVLSPFLLLLLSARTVVDCEKE